MNYPATTGLAIQVQLPMRSQSKFTEAISVKKLLGLIGIVVLFGVSAWAQEVKHVKHVALRAEYRGFIYKIPDFETSALNMDKFTHAAAPSAGIVLTF
jgi:hypothetical protein